MSEETAGMQVVAVCCSVLRCVAKEQSKSAVYTLDTCMQVVSSDIYRSLL